jgi:predicted MFS family arabinose efflux permease
MLGPGLGGLLLESVGIEGGFLLGALLYAVAYRLIGGLGRAERPDRVPGAQLLARLIDGFRLVRRDPALVGTLAVTLIFNLLAWPTTALVPVIAEHDLGLSAFLVGLLVSSDGLGALIGAIAMAVLARPRQFRGIYLGGVALYALGSLLFAFSPWPVLSAVLLVVVGAGNASFASMQAAIVFLSAPPAARSRVMGVLAVCIGSSAFGFAQIGLLASLVGAQAAIVLCSLATLLALALAALAWPAIRPGAPPPDAIRSSG